MKLFKLLFLITPLCSIAASALAVCPEINVYPFVDGCPLTATGLNNGIGQAIGTANSAETAAGVAQNAASASAVAASASAADAASAAAEAEAAVTLKMNRTGSDAVLPDARVGGLGIREFNPVKDHGAPIDGTTSAKIALDASIADCVADGGGRIYIDRNASLYYPGDLELPVNCWIVGDGARLSNNDPVWTRTPSIKLDSANGIKLLQKSGVTGVALIRHGIADPTTPRQAFALESQFAGTGLIVWPGAYVHNVSILGFATGISAVTGDFSISDVQIDAKTCIAFSSIANWSNTRNIECHPFGASGQANITTSITGAADNGSGAIRLTVSSSASFLTGDVANMLGVGGFTGANAKCTVAVINATTIDCTGTASTRVTNGTWIAGSRALHVATTANIGLGQTVTAGAGLPSGATVTAVDQWQNVVYISAPTTSAQTATATTFTNAAYTSGGTLGNYVTVRHSPAYTITSSDGVDLYALNEYGHEIGFQIDGGGNWTKLVSSSCDGPSTYDPANVCVKFTGASKIFQWIGGAVYITGSTALYYAPTDVNNASAIFGVNLNGHHLDVSPYVAVSIAGSGGSLSLTGVSLPPWTGGEVMSIADGIGKLMIAGSNLVNMTPYFDTPSTKSSVYVGQDSTLGGWLYGGGSADTNLVLNGGFALDQRQEGAVYTNYNSNSFVDGWGYALVRAAGFGVTAQRVASTLPAASFDLATTITSAASPNAGDLIALMARVEGSSLRGLGWGTINAKPITLSAQMKCTVGGKYTISIDNASNRGYNLQATLAADNPTTVVLHIPGDPTGTWSTADGSAAMRVIFWLTSGTTTGTGGAWTATTGNAMSGQTQLSATNGASCRISNVNVEPGMIAHEFVPLPPSALLQAAQRRYKKTFPIGTAPAQNAGLAGALCTPAASATAGTLSIQWPLAMSKSPTITTYNPSAANANWRDVTGASDAVVLVDPSTAKGATGVQIGEQTTALTVGNNYCIHAVADGTL